MSQQWIPDILGEGFEQRTLDLGEDPEGPLTAVLVRSLPARRGWGRLRRRPLEGTNVLYVHGWSDYFFQRRLARFWTERGAAFYALDLRKYGRSLREGQTPGYIGDLEDYDHEIELALDVIRAEREPTDRLFLLGHSTGGLVLTLWADRHPGVADAVILNSPWLELQLPGVLRQALTPLVGWQAHTKPLEQALPTLDFGLHYTRAQREVQDPTDPAEVNLLWRPEESHPVRKGWLNAILAGHASVAAGLTIEEPVLVLLSSRSSLRTRWSEELTRSDSVLDVEHVARAALRIGSSVTVERIDGAIHDVFLSAPRARDDAFGRVDRWLSGYGAGSGVKRRR